MAEADEICNREIISTKLARGGCNILKTCLDDLTSRSSEWSIRTKDGEQMAFSLPPGQLAILEGVYNILKSCADDLTPQQWKWSIIVTHGKQIALSLTPGSFSNVQNSTNWTATAARSSTPPLLWRVSLPAFLAQGRIASHSSNNSQSRLPSKALTNRKSGTEGYPRKNSREDDGLRNDRGTGSSGAGGGKKGGGNHHQQNPRQKRNVIREKWCIRRQFRQPIFPRLLKIYEDCKASKICIGCGEKLKFWYQNVPCLHAMWCHKCIRWVEEVLKKYPSESHLCMICDVSVSDTLLLPIDTWASVFEKESGEEVKWIKSYTGPANVISEYWARDHKLSLPMRPNILRAYVACEHKRCIRCRRTVEESYIPCAHALWCKECKRWVEFVLKTNPRQPHLCMICDKAVQEFEFYVRDVNYGELFITNPQPTDEQPTDEQPSDVVWVNWLEEQGEQGGGSFLNLDEKFQKIKKTKSCYRCQSQATYRNLPCKHAIWCSKCKVWAEKIVQNSGLGKPHHLCIHCEEVVEDVAEILED